MERRYRDRFNLILAVIAGLLLLITGVGSGLMPLKRAGIHRSAGSSGNPHQAGPTTAPAKAGRHAALERLKGAERATRPSREPRIAASIAVRSREDKPPLFSKTAPDGEKRLALFPGRPWRFSVLPDDPGALIYTWKLDGVVQNDEDAVFDWIPPERDYEEGPKEHIVEVLVTDSNSNSSSFCWVVLVAIPAPAAGLTRYFVGDNGSDWSDGGNWAAASGDAGGAGAPGAGDLAIFDVNSPDCVCDAQPNVGEIELQATFTNKLDLAGFGAILGSGGVDVDGGTLDMGSGQVRFATSGGDFNQSGGTATMTSGDCRFEGNCDLRVSGGTFNHGGGRVLFLHTNARQYIHINGRSLNQVYISKGAWQMEWSSDCIIEGLLNIAAIGGLRGNFDVFVRGNVRTQDIVWSIGSDIKMVFDGGTDQTIDADGGSGALPRVKIDKATGTLFFEDTIYAGLSNSGTFEYVKGAVDFSGCNHLRFLGHDCTVTLSQDLTIACDVSVDTDAFDWIVNGSNLILTGSQFDLLDYGGTHGSGEVHVKCADFDVRDANEHNSTLVFRVNGDGNQLLHSSTGNGELPALKIDKTSGTLTITDTIGIRGDSSVSPQLEYVQGTVDASASTFKILGADTVTFKTGTMVLGGVQTATNGGHYHWRVDGECIIGGNISIPNATVNEIRQTNGGFISLRGNLDSSDPDVEGGCDIKLNGTGDQTVSVNGGEFGNGNLIVDKTLGVARLVAAFAPPNWAGSVTVQQGVLDLNANNLSITNDVTVEASGTLRLEGGETFTDNNNLPTLNAGSTVEYDGGGGAYTIRDWAYRNLTINNAASVFSLGAAEAVDENLTISAGVLDLAGNDLTVTGQLFNNAALHLEGGETVAIGTMDVDSGMVEYNGGADYTGGNLAAGTSYFNLTFNNAAGSWGHSSALDVNGSLTVAAGELRSAAGQDITLAGDWNNSGTYTHGTNTVTLDGTGQSITGSTVFNNLAKTAAAADTLTFAAGSTQTVAGTLTLEGTSGQLLDLRSSAPGTAWSIDPQGARAVEFCDAQDSTNSNATVLDVAGKGCVDSGRNVNWKFVNPTSKKNRRRSDRNVEKIGCALSPRGGDPVSWALPYLAVAALWGLFRLRRRGFAAHGGR